MTKAFAVVLIVSFALAGIASAADKAFSAVGKITKLSPTLLTVHTSTQDLEIAHDAKTKVVGGPLRNGGVATITYTKPNGHPYANEVVLKRSDR